MRPHPSIRPEKPGCRVWKEKRYPGGGGSGESVGGLSDVVRSTDVALVLQH
jgi:hypothetical protein